MCIFIYILDYRREEEKKNKQMQRSSFNLSRLFERVQSSVKYIFSLRLHIFPTSFTVLHCHCSGICLKKNKTAKCAAIHFARNIFKSIKLEACQSARRHMLQPLTWNCQTKGVFLCSELISTLALQSPPKR